MGRNSTNYHLMSGIALIVACYCAAACAHYFPGLSNTINQLVAQELLNNAENAASEVLSAVFWFGAFLIFSASLLRQRRAAATKDTLAWLFLFCALSLFAFGEETSWGDHLFDYSEDLAISAINAQGETNLHNLNLAALIGLPESNPLYYWLSNLGHLLTPLFYFVLAVLWVMLPLSKDRYLQPVLRNMPVAERGTILFFVCHGAVFVTIDTLFFNVGQIFEMFIGLFALLVAIDILVMEEPSANGSAQVPPRNL